MSGGQNSWLGRWYTFHGLTDWLKIWISNLTMGWLTVGVTTEGTCDRGIWGVSFPVPRLCIYWKLLFFSKKPVSPQKNKQTPWRENWFLNDCEIIYGVGRILPNKTKTNNFNCPPPQVPKPNPRAQSVLVVPSQLPTRTTPWGKSVT